MIKFIASDVDGTLIMGGNTAEEHNRLDPKVFQLIRQCRNRGIVFGVASGRAYANLKKVFLPVWRDIYFFSDNGTAIFYKDKLIRAIGIPTPLLKEISLVLAQKPEIAVGFTTPHKLLVFEEPKEFVDLMVYGTRNATMIIDSLEEIYEEEILNISAYVPEDIIDQQVADYKKRWGDKLQITKSGGSWVDIALSGKGAGIRSIMNQYGINKDQAMVFGDNYNDIELFKAATYSYAMEGAVDGVKKEAAYVTDSVPDVIEYYLNTGKIKK